MTNKFYLALAAFCFFLSSRTNAQPPQISYQTAVSGLSAPLDIVNAGDGSNRLFIVEQGGIIKLRNGSTASTFMDLGPSGINIISTGGERGLLSMAFHPDYDGATNRFFFVYYTDLNGDIAIRRYQTTLGNPNVGDAGSGQLIITIPHPGQSNHNGGKLNFGADGYLYFATGDGGGANDVPGNAQNGASLLGKMIRIDINTTSSTYGNYSVPADNPFVGNPNIDERIWALGLRNPFRWSFDRANGNMWIGDVGQGAKEEVNFRPAGSTGGINYGWRCYEGSISTPGVADCTPANNVFPVFDYDNPNGGASPSSAVTGGFVYRGSEYPGFKGYYIATDVYSGTIYLIRPNGAGWITTSQTGLQNFVTGFGEAQNGDLYAASQATGTVYKVVATGGTILPVTLTSFSVKHYPSYNELKWVTGFEQGTARFRIEYSTNNTSFQQAGVVAAGRNANGGSYSFRHAIRTTTPLYYRLAVEDDNGSVKYSTVLKVSGDNEAIIKIYPTVVQDGVLNILIPKPEDKLQLINSSGSLVFEKSLKNIEGTTAISLPSLPKGMYVVRITGTEMKAEKIIVE